MCIDIIYQVAAQTDRTIATSFSSVTESSSHNQFIHPQPLLYPSQRSESSSTPSLLSAHNPCLHRNVPTRSGSGNTKLPPLPPVKPLATPSKQISSHNRFSSKSVLASSHTHRQSLPNLATTSAQTSSNNFSNFQATNATQSRRTIGQRTCYASQSGTRGGSNKKNLCTLSLRLLLVRTNVRRLYLRTQQRRPSPPLSASSFEQVALATTHLPSSTTAAFSNPENFSTVHAHGHPRTSSSLHFRSRIPVDSTLAIPYNSSLERVEQVWIFQMLQSEVDFHQPTSIENLIIYNNRITIIRRILVLNLIHIPIRLLVAV